MGPFLTLLAIVAGSYLILRKICMTIGERESTTIELFAIGIVTRVFLLSSVVWCLLPVYLMYLVLAAGDYGALFPLMFIGIASGAAYQTNELLGSGAVFFYIKEASDSALQTSTYLYRLKQDMYLLLQVLNTDPWLQSYSEFYDRMIAICYGIEPDSFGHTQQFAFLKIDILRIELTQREGKFFNTADLHTIAALTFNNGKPLTGSVL